MRLDLFLKKTVIIKRRTIAKEIVERGHVQVNGKVAKPSTDVKDGDILDLALGNHRTKVKAKVELRGNKEFPSYEIIEDLVVGQNK